MQQLDLYDVVLAARASGEEPVARAAIMQLEDHDLLWKIADDPALARWVGRRLQATFVDHEPF